MTTGEIVASGLGVGEGPCWCADGTVVVTSVDHGLLWRIQPQTGEKTVLARTGGGPNGATPAADGGFMVTQNGGFDFAAMGLPCPPLDRVEPGLQRVAPDGSVAYRLKGGFNSPNDLAVAPDGTLYFTDPPRFPYQAEDRAGRVWALSPGAAEARLAGQDFTFCNGVGIGRTGDILVIEHEAIVRLGPAGKHETVVRHPGTGDGFCVDAQGRLYVATPADRGVRVFEDGREVDFLPAPGGERLKDGEIFWSTNCCFGGADLRTLFLTTGCPGHLIAFEAMPTPGLPVKPWSE